MKRLSILFGTLAMSLPMFAYYDGYERAAIRVTPAGEDIIFTLIILCILVIIFSCKISGLKNEITKLDEKNNTNTEISKRYLRQCIINENFDEADKYLRKIFVNIIHNKYNNIADFQEPKWVANFDKMVNEVLKKFEPYYQFMNMEVPDALKHVKPELFVDFGKTKETEKK